MANPNEVPRSDAQTLAESPVIIRRIGRSDDDLEITTKDEPPLSIPDGIYQAQCTGWEKRRYYGGTMKLYVWFRICDGPYTGVELYRAFNFQNDLPHGTDLYKTLVMLKGSRVRKKTRLPLKLFKAKVLEVEVRTVKVDHKQNPIPEHQQYSVIDRVIKVLAGGGET